MSDLVVSGNELGRGGREPQQETSYPERTGGSGGSVAGHDTTPWGTYPQWRDHIRGPR
ncbi:hypothetical protein [Halovenus sp. HT40]|uniref:hypothetical protein n=1 Tax=Halovenus sp. HT40 TaxID=3126691 RepID=UPI00300F1B21